MEEKPMVMSTTNDKYKVIGIILIILSVLFASAAGFFVWKSFDQQAKIDDLGNKIKQLEKDKNANKSDSEPNNVSSLESYGKIISELQKVYDGKLSDDEQNTLVMTYNEDGSIAASVRVHKYTQQSIDEFFYSTDNGKTWKYFMGGFPGQTPCKDFNTDEIRKIFRIYECRDDKFDFGILEVWSYWDRESR
ncbi:hypothetical protein FWF74_00105 [Candidatus Saccharibacteria bacterium]|nr:hypothetical protein [Candidatus Saccharibacteria bacterium]MCL1962833.1 hypothetical protein [Candidatus Saccharibacteria bacterium]